MLNAPEAWFDVMLRRPCRKIYKVGPFRSRIPALGWLILILIASLLLTLPGCSTAPGTSESRTEAVINPELLKDPADPIDLVPPAGTDRVTPDEVLQNVAVNADLWAACRAQVRGWIKTARDNGWIGGGPK